ncbi:MAG: WD40 repeat domain-containing protein [Chthoniobacterales bacterium]
MKRVTNLTLRFIGLVLFGCIAGSALALTKIQTIPLLGAGGKFGHLSMDASGQRLFVTALKNRSIVVIDLASGELARTLRELLQPEDVCYLAKLNCFLVTDGRDGSCDFFDAKTFVPTGSLRLESDANIIRYDDKAKRVYVGYGLGGLSVIDPKEVKVVDDIPLDNHPEAFQLERNGPRIFVNVPSSHEIVVIDRITKTVKARWPLGPVAGNFSMALDEASQRLFVGCRAPGRLLVFDTTRGKQVARAALHGDCDDLFYDAKRHKIYASCGEGFLDIFTQIDKDHYSRDAAVKTAQGARTSLFDGSKLYLAVPHRDSQLAEIRVYAP